jgi:hypothetical protein
MSQKSIYTELMVVRVCIVGRISVLKIVASLNEIALVVETLCNAGIKLLPCVDKKKM